MSYFTTLPACPNCLEPLKFGCELIHIKNNIFQCSRCGIKFRSDKFVNSYNKSEKIFPFLTEVKLNKIESAYVDWILNDIKGKYLVTWPWDDVQFLPILISEYLSKFENKKVIVFTDLKYLKNPINHKNSDLNNDSPSNNTLLDSLYFLKEKEQSDINCTKISEDSLKKLFKIEKISLNDDLRVYCKIYFNTFDIENIRKFWKGIEKFDKHENLADINGLVISCGYLDENNDIYKSFLEKFVDLYGKDLVKNIEGIPVDAKIDKKDFTSDDGLFELYFYQSYMLNSDFSVNEIFKRSYIKCMENDFDLISFSDKFDYSLVEYYNDIISYSKNHQIYFVNDKNLTDEVIDLINQFEPDLIIGTDIDHLFGENRFKKGRYNQIYKLLRSDFNLLLFSTDLNYRNTYKIGRTDYYLKSYGIIPHTWDYKAILNEIKNIEEYNLSFFSSHFDKIHGKKSNLEVNFCEVEELGIVESIFKIFIEIFDHNQEVKSALKELLLTPLYITGDKRFRVSKRILNFEYLISLIFDADREKWEKIRGIFEKVYNFQLDNPRNPILDKLVDSIKKVENLENMVVIVHGYDKAQLNNILKDKLGEEVSKKILISSWSSLNNDLKKRETPTTYGISTRFPTFDYDIYSCTLSKLDIICSPNNKKGFKNQLNQRFTERGMKPIYLLSEDEDSPKLLKETLNVIDIPEEEEREEFIDFLNKSPTGMDDNNESNTYKGTAHHYNKKIPPNNNAILVLDDFGKGIILPLNRTIFFIDENELIDEIKLNNNNYKRLINQSILLNERETYLSLNEPFLQYVLENGDDIVIRRKKFEWKGFKDLINSMYRWVDILYQIIEKEPDKIEVNKKLLSQNLSELGLSAGIPRYIERVWLNEPKILKTENDEIRIFDAERPLVIDDSRKIFEWIGENYKEFDVSRYSGDKTFNAAKQLQFIRRTFCRNRKQDLNVNMYELLDGFQEVKKGKISNSYKFNVVQVEIKKIKKEVTPYKILEDYTEYID